MQLSSSQDSGHVTICTDHVTRCTYLTEGESHFSVLPLPLSFARSGESKGYPNSGFDRGEGLRASGRYPLKPSIIASLLETKGYQNTLRNRQQCRPDHPESPIFGLNN